MKTHWSSKSDLRHRSRSRAAHWTKQCTHCAVMHRTYIHIHRAQCPWHVRLQSHAVLICSAEQTHTWNVMPEVMQRRSFTHVRRHTVVSYKGPSAHDIGNTKYPTIVEYSTSILRSAPLSKRTVQTQVQGTPHDAGIVHRFTLKLLTQCLLT